jgi:hypothetical protein
VKYYKNPTTFRDTIKKTLHSAWLLCECANTSFQTKRTSI